MEQGLYRIGEVSRLTGLPVKTIRYYAEIGLLAPAATAPSRYRLYGEAQVWRLGLVRTLRHLGFSLEEIRGILAGEADVAEAIELQLEAVETRITQLERVRAALRRARPGGGAARESSLDHLRAVGAAPAMGEAERSRLLAQRLLALTGGCDLPPEWRERLLDGVARGLPAELTSEQVDAWGELVGLLAEPGYREESRIRGEPFREMAGAGTFDAGDWHGRMEGISRGAREALRAGEGPGSPHVQEVVGEWVALFAGAMGKAPDPEFERLLAEIAPTWLDPRGVRLRELLTTLEWGGEGDEPWRAERLLLDGLAWRVSRHDEDAGGG